jgi:hypothetical protein
MIVIKHKGDFKNTELFLKRASKFDVKRVLERYGREGVAALSSATPKDTGLTASSWDYEVIVKDKSYIINWTNSNIVNGVPIAIILQFGHGTRNGGWVEGRDYINPAIRHIFDQIVNDVRREVTRR